MIRTRDIVTVVCDEFGVTERDLYSPARAVKTAQARLIAYWLARREGRTYEQIGQAIGRKHQAVSEGAHRATFLMLTVPGLRAKVERCQARLG